MYLFYNFRGINKYIFARSTAGALSDTCKGNKGQGYIGISQ